MSEEELENIEISSETTEDKEIGGVPVRQQLLLVAAILLLIFGTIVTSVFTSGTKGNPGTGKSAVPYTDTEKISSKTEESIIQPFSEVSITADAAYVFDVQNQRVLYKKNESVALPLASVTKLMTALVAYEVLADSDAVEITDMAVKQDGDSGLQEGEVFERRTLTDLVLMSSSNDGAYALAVMAGDVLNPEKSEDAFVQAMNVRANELGLYETTFLNPTGLDISTTKAGASGSARDVAFLMEYIVTNIPEILAYTKTDTARLYSKSGQKHEAENTNYYIDEIPGLIGSKTGYTDLAGGNLVIAYNAGLTRPIIISVLGSTQINRFTDVLKLIDETEIYLANE